MMRWWMLPIVFILGGATGWWVHRPEPVYIEDVVVHTIHGTDTVVEKTVTGPVRVETVTETKYTPGPERPGPTITKVVTHIEQRDPVIIEKGSVKEFTGIDAKQSITVMAPAKPDWALGVGAQFLPDKRIQLTLERRLLGPVWAQAWVLQPLQINPPAVGLGLKVEF